MSPPESRAIVAGLQAFSTYQMRVVSINMAGSVTSVWTTARTMEGGAYRFDQDLTWFTGLVLCVFISDFIEMTKLVKMEEN